MPSQPEVGPPAGDGWLCWHELDEFGVTVARYWVRAEEDECDG